MALKAAEQTDPSLFRTPLDVVHQDPASTGTRGQPVLGGWVLDGQIRALLRLLSHTSSTKQEITRQLVPTASHLVVTHYNPLLTNRRTLRLNGTVTRYFRIKHVENIDEQNFENWCICQEEIGPDQE